MHLTPADLPRLKRRCQTEAQFTRQLIQYAHLMGWMVMHQRPARTKRGWATAIQGDAGFPDLVLARGTPGCPPSDDPAHVLIAELKVGRNRPTSMQKLWLQLFEDAGIPTYLWYPSMWDEIEATLRR